MGKISKSNIAVGIESISDSMSGKKKYSTEPNKTEQVESAWKMLRSDQGDLAKGLLCRS